VSDCCHVDLRHPTRNIRRAGQTLVIKLSIMICGALNQGLFVAKEETVEHDIQRTVYIFENEIGTFAIRGNPPLEEQINLVHIGDRVRIEYVGIRTASDSVRYPTYRLWKNRWMALFVPEGIEDEDGIPVL
jgi:hypothetical protein